MTLQTIGDRLAALPEQARAALPDLRSHPARRSWAPAEAIAAFGLGLAAGVLLGFLLYSGASEADPDVIEDPGE